MDAFTQHLHTLFTDHEEKVFLDHFGRYVNLINKERFIINLDDATEHIGFANKGNAKRLLTKYFQEGTDFIIIKNKSTECGRPSETMLLSSNTFKEFCLVANTENSRRIKSYYVKLEEAILERLHNLLQKKQKQKNKLYELGDTLYVRQETTGADIFKVGSTTNMNRRQKGYGSHTLNNSFVYTLRCNDAKLMERVVHHQLRKYALPNKPDYFNLTLDEVVDAIRISHYYIDLPYTRGSPWISPADTHHVINITDTTSKCALLEKMEEVVCNANSYERTTIPDIRQQEPEHYRFPEQIESKTATTTTHEEHEEEEPGQQSSETENRMEEEEKIPILPDTTDIAAPTESTTIQNDDSNEANLPPNVTDFDKFMTECLKVEDGAKAVWNEISCMYRLWSRCTEPRHAQLWDFFKERGFKKTYVYNPETQVNATALLGLKLVPLQPLSLPNNTDYEAFLSAHCVRNVTGRVTKKELGEAFVAWKNDPTYTHITNADKTALFKLCACHSLQSTVHDGTRIREGFYGISMIGKENVGKKFNTAIRKCVEQLDMRTGKVVNKFDSMTNAAMAVGLSVSAISTAISSKRVRGGFFYRYAAI